MLAGAAAEGNPPGTLGAVVSVMSFNIAIGGDVVDLALVAEAIERAGADVVGLQECWGNAPRIAAMLGWRHVDEQHQVISRWPLVAIPEGRGTHLYVQPSPGRVFALANVHLPAYPYGPYSLRDGAGVAEVEELERRTRLAAFRTMAPAWQTVIDAGIPLVLTGDFNAPSHHDWPGAAHRVPAVAWPVSLEAAAMGFVDTYRHANPDRHGITWTYGFPHPRLEPNELQDRIDFVHTIGADAIVSSAVVGPAGTPDVEIPVDPWPSDHLAVLTRLELTPVAPGPFVAVAGPVVRRGGPLAVRYHCPGGSATDRIVLSAVDDDPLTDAIAWLPPIEAEQFGLVSFGSAVLAPGEYAITLLGPGGVLSRTTVWVLEPDAGPAVAATSEGGDLVVGWTAAPARKTDWIGVYRMGDPDLYRGSVARTRTGAGVTGVHRFPLPPGDYTVRLFSDGSTIVLAETEVTVP